MKIIGYYFAKLVLKLHGKNSDYHQEVSLWALICFKLIYICLIIIFPIYYKISEIFDLSFLNSKKEIFFCVLPIIIVDYFYFFWDGRWKKKYEEVKQWNPKRRKIHRNNLILIVSIITIGSIIFQYYTIPFGRW